MCHSRASREESSSWELYMCSKENQQQLGNEFHVLDKLDDASKSEKLLLWKEGTILVSKRVRTIKFAH